MKVYYNGLNLHRQFPTTQNIVENFIDHVYKDSTNFEVSYHYVAMLVADTLILNGVQNKTIEIPKKVIRFVCNEEKLLVHLENGDLLIISNNATSKMPILLNRKDDSVKQISLGSRLLVVVTKMGDLYNVPCKLNYTGDEIVEIKTGREHCLIRDKKGNIYSFGRGSRGQLGHGSLEDENHPKLIKALDGIKIKAIATGGWHSCALSKEGDLYVWGWNGNGQLGLSENEESGDVVGVMASPQVLDLDFNLKMIGCGNRHTVILSENGELYGCGWNKYKQLKKSGLENIYKMVSLGNFSREEVKDIKCGPWNTVIVCG